MDNMDRVTTVKTVRAWLEEARNHKCAVKKMMPKDDDETIGHVCACGVVFSISLSDYKKTIDELEPEFRSKMVKDAMSSKRGREILAGVLK
jgi:hypothetical protein